MAKPVKVLVVEDIPGDLVLTLGAFNEARVSNHLRVVEDAEEAIRYLRREDTYADASIPDLILDLNLPKMDSRDVLRKIKKDENLRPIPVVVLTTSIADIATKASKLQDSYRILRKSYLDSIKVLAEVIETKDPYTRGHSDRVRALSREIAARLGFTEDRLENLEYGALLHDIGKIGIQDELLLKQGVLTAEERHSIQKHSLIGVRIVKGMDFFKDNVPMIQHHHERYEGNGYPDRLSGKTIPIEARIIAIADAFDAMTSMRPYRKAMSLEETLVEMERGGGKQFDPQLLSLFIEEKLYLYPNVAKKF